MHRRSSRSSVAGLAGLVLAVGMTGCGSDDDDGGGPDRAARDAEAEADAEEPSGWPIEAAPSDVEVIDRDLVARVLVELDRHIADLHRAVVREGEVGELAQALASSIYTADAAPTVLERLRDHEDEIRDEVATPRSAVVELGSVDVGCVDALVRRDLAPVLDVTDGIGTWQVTLVTVDDSDNGTAWRMARDEPGDEPPTGCR